MVRVGMKKEKTSVQNKRASATSLRKEPLPPGDDLGAADLAKRVGTQLREKRKTRGMSLDELAVASGVSRAALSQIELCKSNPSLGVLWKIAVGLGIPFAELMGGEGQGMAVLRRSDAQVLRSADGKLESRPLSPAGSNPVGRALRASPGGPRLALVRSACVGYARDSCRFKWTAKPARRRRSLPIGPRRFHFVPRG
jgi:transcriptional regulator with XRE-family HTH domain